MINGMIILVHMPLFGVRIPDTAMGLVKQLMSVATFDIPGCSMEEIFGPDYWADSSEVFYNTTDNVKNGRNITDFLESLDELGYSSHYMAFPMGSIYLIIIFNVVVLLILLLMKPLRRCCLDSQGAVHRGKCNKKLKKLIFWNGIIRLCLEACLELTFCVLLNAPFFTRIF
jgi:hypothetical protein